MSACRSDARNAYTMVQAWMANNPGVIPPGLGPQPGPFQVPAGAAYAGLSISNGVTLSVIPGVIGAGATTTHAQLNGNFVMDENGVVTADTLAAK
jgi:hypothetical protein